MSTLLAGSILIGIEIGIEFVGYAEQRVQDADRVRVCYETHRSPTGPGDH